MPKTPPVQNQTQPTPKQNNTPPTTQTPPQPKPKKKTPWILISIVVFLLGAIGVLGYKFYQAKQKLDNQQSTPLSSPQLVTSSPSPASLISEIKENSKDGWKTYINNKAEPPYKFSCPSNLQVKDYDIERNCINIVGEDFKLGIAIAGDDHPCYLATGGFAEETHKTTYAIQAINSKFDVTETLSIYKEIDQYGDYHPPDQRRFINIRGEGINGIYFSYSDSEKGFYQNEQLVKKIIESVEWLN